MMPRSIQALVRDRLGHIPAVALLAPAKLVKPRWPRQCGEPQERSIWTLNLRSIWRSSPTPTFYLSGHQDELVVLDEVQRMPELFATLRGLIDQGRRRGRRDPGVSCCWAPHPPICCGSRRRSQGASPISN